MPELSVILPCYNEVRSIRRVLELVSALPIGKQIIVVDDGSNDGSAQVIRELCAADTGLSGMYHQVNCGKGTAIRTGLSQARGIFTIIQDADSEYDPGDILKLLERIQADPETIVYGTRQLAAKASRRHVFGAGVGMLNLLARRLYGVRLSDIMTCYKLAPTELLQRMDLRCTGFEFCSELTAKACRMGCRIVEVPISYHPRARRDGKKIRLRDGAANAAALWRHRHWSPPV